MSKYFSAFILKPYCITNKNFMLVPLKITVQLLELLPNLKRKLHRITVILVQNSLSVGIP